MRELSRLYASSEPFFLITVIGKTGSAPCGIGSKIAVTAGAAYGTIGGGHLEFSATNQARGWLMEKPTIHRPTTNEVSLGASLGQCCGGKITLLYEPVNVYPFQLVIFGSGHIGREIAALVEGLPIKLTLIDSRADQFPKVSCANIHLCHSDDPLSEPEHLDKSAAVIVMTHSHDLDFDLIHALFKHPFRNFIGLIGSSKKRRRFEYVLKKKGVPEDQIQRLVCPIGIGDIRLKHPKEVAIDIVARLLQFFYQSDTT